MARYRRVNIDGQSLYKTETRTTAAALLPGTAAVINSSNKFAQATALAGRIYIIDVAYHQGLKITDAVPAGDSAVGNYVEEGRELALRCLPGAYKKDSPIKIGTAGQFTLATSDTDSEPGVPVLLCLHGDTGEYAAHIHHDVTQSANLHLGGGNVIPVFAQSLENGA